MSNLPGFLDFTRPGPGFVDDSQLHPFVRFWKRYGRHFFKLLQVNLVYALVTLPVYGWLMSLINAVTTQTGGGVVSVLGSLLLYVALGWPVWLRAALVGGSILLLGPATAALGRAALDCAWSRPGLFWPNFWEAWRRSWRQALPVGLADVLAVFATLYYLVDGETFFRRGRPDGAEGCSGWRWTLRYAMCPGLRYPFIGHRGLPWGGPCSGTCLGPGPSLCGPGGPGGGGVTGMLCAVSAAGSLVADPPCFLLQVSRRFPLRLYPAVIFNNIARPCGAGRRKENEESEEQAYFLVTGPLRPRPLLLRRPRPGAGAALRCSA